MVKLQGDPPKKPPVADVCIQCVMDPEKKVSPAVPVTPVVERIERNYELDEVVRILINLQVRIERSILKEACRWWSSG